ncbi:MAG: hypothetical protein U7127_30875 (plasmid) [Phormidium sp.]
MAISLGALGIRTNSRKLLNTAVELAESRLYFQALADGTVESHNGKAVRAKLYQQLEEVSDEELLALCHQLLTLIEVGKRSSDRYERIQAAKANKPEVAATDEF